MMRCNVQEDVCMESNVGEGLSLKCADLYKEAI